MEGVTSRARRCSRRMISNMTPRKVEEDKLRYSFRSTVSRPTRDVARASIRPVSAPHRDAGTRRARVAPRSAKARIKHGITDSEPNVVNDDSGEMFNVVRAAKEAKSFQEDAAFYRSIERSMQEREVADTEKNDTAPVFNKRLFASQGAVIITNEARRLMNANAQANAKCDLESLLTKSNIQSLRCVVDGLKLIHKGQDFVKDVLSKVVTYEVYKPFEYVPVKSWEEHLSCYYILNGAVEVTYDLRSKESGRHVFQANIIYSHGTGEYLGLVSPEGPKEDLSPPATIYTKEMTQFIRVDRERFHKLMLNATDMIDKRKRDFISCHSFLSVVADEVKEKILHKLSIQEYPANRVLLSQGDVTEFIFIVMKGRCQSYKEIYIPEAEREVLFYLTSRDQDDFFGEECVLERVPSLCTVVTATATTCLKLHRTALKMVNKEKLTRHINERRHDVPTDVELRDRGYNDSMWNRFKHTQVKATLKEAGHLQYLTRPKSAAVRERPPGDDEIYTENMRRFMVKGSQFQPMRIQSAHVNNSQRRHSALRRPRTAFAGSHEKDATEKSEITEKQEPTEANEDKEEKSEAENTSDKEIGTDSTGTKTDADASESSKGQSGDGQGQSQGQSKLLTVEKARHMEQSIQQAMESKETLLRALDEQSDVSSQLKQAWKAENTQEMQNFMKNGVMVTMTSEDIVRKAKALADTYADKWNKNNKEAEEEWDTILHAENKQAKMLITANRIRMKDIKRRLAELQKKRERDKRRNAPRKADDSDSDE